MRLTLDQIDGIRSIVAETAGSAARVRLFGSRVRDDLRGGDVDLLVESDEAVADPALLSARIAGRVSRLMHGRHVDVVLRAPNLERLAVHTAAEREGVLL